MKLKDILKAKGSTIFSIDPEKSVKDAIDLLVQFNVGSLMVIDEGRLVGIFSERDSLRLCARDLDSILSTRIADVMTTDLIIGKLDDDVEDSMNVMTEKRIRHLPVLDNGYVVGLVSLGDLVKSQLAEKTVTIHYLRDYITGKDMR
ncbi:MAG TPA: CBS domain-containing protein [Bacteroidota bacterium]|nr:CBS domain-containing protein [Bacteroidota bacterium]